MFFHLIKYKFITIIKQRSTAFWTMIFPLALGTCFYFAFGNLNQLVEQMDPIDIVLVDEVGIVDGFLDIGLSVGEKMFLGDSGDLEAELLKPGKKFSDMDFDSIGALNEDFISSPEMKGLIMMGMLMTLSEEGDNQMFHTYTTGKEEAEQLLKKDDVKAVVSITDDGPVLTFAGTGLEQTIVKSFFDQYQQTESVTMELMTENGVKMEDLSDMFGNSEESAKLFEKTTISGSEVEDVTYFFYALIAMACLYGVFVGMRNSIQMQANLSTLAARRSCAPTKKLTTVMADFIASVLFHWICIAILLIYLTQILGIDLGDKYGFIILTCMIGSMIGISFGQFVGAISGLGEGMKLGIVLGVTMVCCFMGDLMASGIKHSIELKFPLLNRINPAVLISDSFYCLNVYDNYDKYITQTVSMGVIAGIFLIGSALMLRRKKYACL